MDNNIEKMEAVHIGKLLIVAEYFLTQLGLNIMQNTA
jgi:hypothetical protein